MKASHLQMRSSRGFTEFEAILRSTARHVQSSLQPTRRRSSSAWSRSLPRFLAGGLTELLREGWDARCSLSNLSKYPVHSNKRQRAPLAAPPPIGRSRGCMFPVARRQSMYSDDAPRSMSACLRSKHHGMTSLLLNKYIAVCWVGNNYS